VITAKSTTDSEPADTYVVATADCDLANEKHFGRILALPVISLTTYFNQFRIPIVLERLKWGETGLAQRLVTILNTLIEITGDRPLEYDVVLEWLERRRVEGIVGDLRKGPIPEDKQLQFDEQAGEARNLGALLDCEIHAGDHGAVLKFIRNAKEALNQKLPKGEQTFLEREFKDLLRSRPKDVFFLAELVPEQAVGYAVLLRFPVQVLASDIASEADGVRHGKRFERKSRIVYPYSVAMMTQFAHLFTGVGLPEGYIESLDIAAEFHLNDWKSGSRYAD
jgi:hypothetical protein